MRKDLSTAENAENAEKRGQIKIVAIYDKGFGFSASRADGTDRTPTHHEKAAWAAEWVAQKCYGKAFKLVKDSAREFTAFYSPVSASSACSAVKNKSPKFELMAPLDPATEKKLEGHRKNIKVYADGVRRSGAQFFGYAYLAGREMNLVKELKILPHGDFEKWVAASFPDITDKTSRNWRSFAEAIEAKRETVSLLNGQPFSLSGKKKLSKAEEKAVFSVVPEVMDGMGMVEFMRATGFLKEPADKGGWRPDPQKLEAWLKKNHPELAGTKWDDLDRSIQKAAQRDILAEPDPGANDPKKLKEAADYAVKEYGAAMLTWCEDKQSLSLCSTATLRAMEENRLALGRTLAEILKNR